MNTRYVALLRGINVGHKMVKMEILRKTLEEVGFTNVKTLLNSGNVVFETKATNAENLSHKIEEQLKKTFSFQIDTIVRPMTEIEKLIHSDPFKGVRVTPDTRLYVTFLSEKPTSKLKIPYVNQDKNYKILAVSHFEIISVLTLTPNHKTPEAMMILEKEFGKKITTRNWNTVLKIAALRVGV